ncbi:uncharacterized protein [Heterodontus francisci]|uniref:uncharacterized protein isoform X2 n=1 Tax=Heterodontus francisci TaxID=7792 RepID=UPI00355C3352
MFLMIFVAFCFSAVNAAPSFSGTGDGTYPHDISSQSGLTNLYNKRVLTAERVTRPMPHLFGLPHSGVRVTTSDGRQWLIHKGSGYGRSSQTVVTDATHMSDQWSAEAPRPVTGHTVGDFVRVGGESYSLPSDNCHHATSRMMDQLTDSTN